VALPSSGKTTLAKQHEWLYDLGLDFYDDEIRIQVEKLQ